MTNPFESIDQRLQVIERLLIDLKHPEPCVTSTGPDELLTREEGSRILRCSPRTMINLEKSGKIKGQRIGRRVLYKKSELLKAVESPRKLVA
jgi:hypothetical protein